ncbi:hypothetical protein GALL_526770 [mine drainage metagenome]|uniref:Uncharacterized protein n=1 Tax=mine drainage metagenome TaxID=410659 RepID=A0A1J5P3T1_9ZZZZ
MLETFDTALRIRLIAQISMRIRDHLAVMVTNRQIFVQRHHDLSVRQGAFDDRERFHTDVDIVMEMHDVGPQVQQHVRQRVRQARILIGEFEPVEFTDRIQIIANAEGLADRNFRSGAATIAAHEPGDATFPGGKAAMKLKRRNFRPALRYFGMAVGDDEYPQCGIRLQRLTGFDGNGRWKRRLGFGDQFLDSRNDNRLRLRYHQHRLRLRYHQHRLRLRYHQHRLRLRRDGGYCGFRCHDSRFRSWHVQGLNRNRRRN